MTIGEKIRSYRELRGFSQVTLAELSKINVGTIRKYELGIRNPKPDQLTKIANALGLNVSVFLDFNVETVGDVLALLFSIEDAVDLKVERIPDSESVSFTFKSTVLQDIIKQWANFKMLSDNEREYILKIEDENIRKAELEKLETTINDWKLLILGRSFGTNFDIRKGTKGIRVKIQNS